MAKKNKKIEKETRKAIEAISDVLKKKGDRYKFKRIKKKTIKSMKRSCQHWIIRRGKEDPALRNIQYPVLSLENIIDKETKINITKLLNSGSITDSGLITVLSQLISDKPAITVPYWECTICNAKFPVDPATPDEYDTLDRLYMSCINQIQFWSVRMGGNAEDTKIFLRLKELLPRFMKIRRQVVKEVNKREKYEDNKAKTDLHSQFDGFSSFSYH